MDIRRTHIIVAIVVFALCALLLNPGLLSAIFVFLFLGIVPGTDITLPWWVMILAFLIALAFGIRWLLDQPVYQPVATNKDLALRRTARKRVLKQTSTRKSAAKRYKKQTVKA